MTSFITIAAIALAAILLPITILLWATESRHTRIQRYRAQGQTWKAISVRYGVSQTTVRRWAKA